MSTTCSHLVYVSQLVSQDCRIQVVKVHRQAAKMSQAIEQLFYNGKLGKVEILQFGKNED